VSERRTSRPPSATTKDEADAEPEALDGARRQTKASTWTSGGLRGASADVEHQARAGNPDAGGLALATGEAGAMELAEEEPERRRAA